MIAKEIANRVLTAAMGTGGDFAEIYVEDQMSLSLGLREAKIEEAIQGAHRGAGVRVLFGNLATYAYTNDLNEESLLQAAQVAAAVGSRNSRPQSINLTHPQSPHNIVIPAAIDDVDLIHKSELLHRMDEAARAFDPHITQLFAEYNQVHSHIWVFNSQDLCAEDKRDIIELSVRVLAQKKGAIQHSFGGLGGQTSIDLCSTHDPIALSLQVAESAINMLDARPAPAGEMTVVINNGSGGNLIHEACGHALESDFVSRGSSAYAGLIGQQVASPLINVIDDGTVPNQAGSMRFDDDGTPSSQTVLIECGQLKEYMWDHVEARRMGCKSTGNGRRQSFHFMPIPRMTNTYITAGPHDPEEIISSVKKGLYVKRLGAGEADIAKGDFVFGVAESYLIENGKLTAPVRGATITGNGPKVLCEIDMVGTDFAFDPSASVCSKGQRVYVGVGQPTIRVPHLIVGGINEDISDISER